jgi:hypothetical protein
MESYEQGEIGLDCQFVIMVRENVLTMGSTPTKRDEDDTSSQAQNCDKISTALV